MAVVCYGDSNTWGYDPRSRCGEPYPADSRWVDILSEISGWTVRNEGMNGREIPDNAIDVPEDTDLLIIMLGTNDLLQFWPPEDAAGKMRRFLMATDMAHNNLLLVAPPPMCFGEWVQDQELIEDSIKLANLYKALANQLGIHFLNAGEWGIALGHDGVHFTADGHRAFANALYQNILSFNISIS